MDTDDFMGVDHTKNDRRCPPRPLHFHVGPPGDSLLHLNLQKKSHKYFRHVNSPTRQQGMDGFLGNNVHTLWSARTLL